MRFLSTSHFCPIVLFEALLLFAGTAGAWDVSIGVGFLDNALYVASQSGPGYTWTTLDERVRASDVPGPTVPVVWTTQSWDDMAQTWPSDFLSVSEGITDANISHSDAATEFWDSGEAYVFGSVAAGDAVGTAVAYDFEFVVLPFTTVEIFLDPSETYVYLESGPGDAGNAFATFSLYSPSLGLNDPGGVNMPWAQDSYTIAAGDPLVEDFPTFSKVFTNSTGSAETHHLRIRAVASVFAVPEPAMGATLVAGAFLLTGLGRSRGK